MAKSNYELTEAEWVIMEVVWQNEPCAAPTVQEALHGKKQWSYSTVKTIMDRMAHKGLLKTKRLRNLILYSSAISKQQAQKGELMRTLKRAFAGALTPMMQFLIEQEDLSEEELHQLRRLIDKQSQKKKH